MQAFAVLCPRLLNYIFKRLKLISLSHKGLHLYHKIIPWWNGGI